MNELGGMPDHRLETRVTPSACSVISRHCLPDLRVRVAALTAHVEAASPNLAPPASAPAGLGD